MLKYQRESLAIQTEDPEAKMQMFYRRIVHNFLNKNTLQGHRYIFPYSSTVHHNLTSEGNKLNEGSVRNYATKKQNLLRYPALPLEETMGKYIKSVEPFLNKEEREENWKHCEVFLKCEGKKLQKFLEDVAAKEENWLSDRWLRGAYLQYRDPVTIFSSPGQTFPPVSFKDDEDYLCYTAKVIFCLIKYKQIIDANKIPVLKIGKNELDNGQFGKVLGTVRIPVDKEDKLQYHPKSLHVVVIYKNHFYKLRVYSQTLNPVHPDVIYEELKKIFKKEKKDGVPFGILTSDKRDNWAKAYKVLLSIEGNKKAVEEIQQSLFTVSLDGEVCFDPCTPRMNVLGDLLMHGCGSDMYAGNRWFDKTIQLIVSRSGFQGFCYEHSPAEGQPIANMVDYMVKNLNDKKLREGADCEVCEPAQKLKLKSSPALDKHIATAKINVDKLVGDLHLHVTQFEDYGKGFLKKQKLSPDSFVQMALQYAFYKMYKTAGAAYESAHLRIFRNGRTETIRSCSNESMDFVRAMYEPCPDEERVRLMRRAVTAHREYTTMALQGRGIDRHLFGLKMMALENKLDIPEFYTLPSFKRSSHFRVSTSQVASPNEAFMCYGPMFYDGYACCYNPREEDIFLAVTSWRSCEDTSTEQFSKALVEALQEMQCALVRGAEKEKPKCKL